MHRKFEQTVASAKNLTYPHFLFIIRFWWVCNTILQYGCQFWNPYLVKHIESIESIQRRATRVLCGSEKEHQERLGVLKWPSLEFHRRFICLVQMYKIIFGHCDIDPHMLLFYFNGLAKTRRNHNFTKKSRTNYFKFSFFNRYISDWYSIPSNIMHAPS